MEQRSRSNFLHKMLLVIIFLGSGLRVFLCLKFNPMDFLFSDPLRHWMNATRFPKGAYFGASDPIGYQAYLWAVQHLTFHNRLLIGLVAGLLSAFMPWTFYRAARAFGMRKVPALWVWALIVWTPSLLAIYHYTMMETLLLLLEGVAFWATAHHLRKGNNRAFIVSVLCWTLAALTKPTVIPLAAVCVLWSLWKKMPSWKTIVAAAALAVALLLPQAIRSEVALGFVAPFGNPWLTKIQHRSGVNTFYLYFRTHPNRFMPMKADAEYDSSFLSPSCVMRPLWPLSDWVVRCASSHSQYMLRVDSQYGERDWKRAYDNLDISRSEWLRLWRENIMLFLFSPSWPEFESKLWLDHLEFTTRWIWAPIMLFVLVGNLFQFARKRFELVPVAVTAFTLFLMLQNVVTFEGRYRKPLEPLLLINLVWIIASWLAGSAALDSHATVVPEERVGRI